MTTEHPIDALKPDPANPRSITAEAATGLGVSMETFDDIAGITWNERSGEFVAGHQRMSQLKAAGATTWTRVSKTEGFVAHPKTKARFRIRVVDWDPSKQRAANLVANNPHLQGEFTPEALAQLKAIDDDVDYAGLRLDALQATLEAGLAATEAASGGNTDPDEVPEPPKVPVTKPGDLWLLGDHRLLCGDSTKAEDVARLMAGQKAFVMNTDPPYGVDYGKTKRGMPGFVYQDTDIVNDTLTEGAELQAFLEAAIRTAVPHLTKTCAFYLWHPMLTQGTFFAAAAAAADILIHRQIIWVKPGFVLTRSGMYHWKHELCFYGWVRGHAPPWYGEKNQTSVIEAGRDNDAGQHPTQKPVALFEFPILNHTRKGQLVYEPFSGSGSQIIAGERLGRPVRAMEIEPRWADVAVSRWQNFTGRKATRQPAAKAPTTKPTRNSKRRRK
jgi:DNA modification methylase